MLDRIRSFFTVVEEGSVNRAALRLRITQPALSRQMKALEDEIGGRLLERGTNGVKPTSLGHVLLQAMRPVLGSYESALAEARRHARGLRSELRIGYLISAAQPVLEPALAHLRTTHPGLKLKLHDMSPKEQMDALRTGDIDVALIGQEGAVASADFFSRKLRSFGVCAALSASDPFASHRSIKIADLKSREFVGVDEEQVPGRNRWIAALCRKAGFKPRFIATTDGITHVLGLVAAESAVTLLPDYFRSFRHPGVKFVPVSAPGARWDFIVLWQRGQVPEATRAFLDALSTTTAPARKQ
jgi:DNA-binding transcriptional LysR family regulator